MSGKYGHWSTESTDQGLEGWGETFGFRALRSAILAIDELIAPLCIGKDAAGIVRLMFEMRCESDH